MNNVQHREDTKYMQWQDGMYVMLDDLMCDYEKALVEDSLRRSVYFKGVEAFKLWDSEDALGPFNKMAGTWFGRHLAVKLSRAQALYIATGDTDI
jgi:hypothetical protein